jgi:hypothetical protein
MSDALDVDFSPRAGFSPGSLSRICSVAATMCRMASGRVGGSSCFAIHASMAAS